MQKNYEGKYITHEVQQSHVKKQINQTRQRISTMMSHRIIRDFRSSDAEHRRVVRLIQRKVNRTKVITKII